MLILASSSPRRAELLTAAGYDFVVHPAHVDESMHPGERPSDYVVRLAVEKARVVQAVRPDDVVIAADTTVVVDEEVLGKPRDAAEAARMLRLLSGRAHVVMTGVCVAARRLEARVAVTTVEFAPLAGDEVDWYVASGEPMDKAGAYGIQGRAARFVTRIEGSYSNVVGLPIALVHEMLRRVAEPN